MDICNMEFSLKNRILRQNQAKSTKRLAVLDFDHTVVDDNSDIVARDLVSPEKIPTSVTNLYHENDWICYMQEIFYILHANNILSNDIQKTIEAIPEVMGFCELIRTLHDDHDFDIIIISDSNTEFIGSWCRRHNIDRYIKHIFTNPAKFDDDGRLLVDPFHHQTMCSLSSPNMCKGAILEDFVRDSHQTDPSIDYQSIFYIGDGRNDICPILRLGKQDFGCARTNYRLEKEIGKVLTDATSQKDDTIRLDATIVLWNDGVELLNKILKQI